MKEPLCLDSDRCVDITDIRKQLESSEEGKAELERALELACGEIGRYASCPLVCNKISSCEKVDPNHPEWLCQAVSAYQSNCWKQYFITKGREG